MPVLAAGWMRAAVAPLLLIGAAAGAASWFIGGALGVALG